MRAVVTVPSCVLVAALLVACGGSAGASSSSSSASAPTSSGQAAALEGTSWSLATTAGVTAHPGGLLAFARGGQLTGSTGCNGFGGTYTQSGSALAITMGAQTAKACAPPLDAQEAAVNAALPKVASFTDDGGRLTLLDGSGAVLPAYTPVRADALVGPHWDVTGITTGSRPSAR